MGESPDGQPAPQAPKGRRVDKEDAPESEHFMRCSVCGGYFDMRDLGEVMAHEGPVPHPAGSRPQ